MEKPELVIVLRLKDGQLEQMNLDSNQQELFDSAKLANDIKSRMVKDEILRDRHVVLGFRLMSSGTAQVQLPKSEVEKYPHRVTQARIYPVYSVWELIALAVSGEIASVSKAWPMFVVMPKKEQEEGGQDG